MKRLATVLLLLVAVGMMITSDVLAQVVKVKVEAMSPGRRSTGAPNYTAPAGPYYVSTGLPTVGKGMKVYLSADTTGSGTTTATSFAWAFTSRPTGSNAAFSATNTIATDFIADTVGSFIVTLTVNGSVTALDTIFASTYSGNAIGATAPNGCFCHGANQAEWGVTLHATIFKRGMTGNLENRVSDNKGAYALSCVKCHTTGWESVTDNGNFGSISHQGSPAWDTTWYKGLPLDGDYWITKDTVGIWNGMSSAQQAVGNIGCESCHGPSAGHKAAFGGTSGNRMTSQTLDAGVCLQCHDAPKKHRLGSYWAASNHSGLKTSKGEAGNKGCWPCHNGSAFTVDAWRHKLWGTNSATRPTKADTVAVDAKFADISCVTCHDPHSDANPKQLRTVAVDSLNNGFVPSLGEGGMGQLCMNCHRGRSNVAKKVLTTAPYYGWGSRFYNHYSPQADMLFGQNGYNYGSTVTGTKSIHLTVTANSCVTCHMQTRTNGSSIHANHEMKMDSAGVDFVGACTGCHPQATTSFSQIPAKADHDGDGTVEGFVDEINGLMSALKAKLPIDAATGEPTTSYPRDTLLVKNRPDLVQGLWNYYFIKYDFSNGIHNPAYSVALLKASIAAITTGVEQVDQTVPYQYSLGQNYPNPFNPETWINFSLPARQLVTLEVFDLLGKRVATLVNETKEPANYKVRWNGLSSGGERMPSGVYIYRLQAGEFSFAKKMVMLK